ncbi:MAG: TIGR02147 family protein, partial [Deltaproteobacteria bacterium]|nr:TIGR02147 family protein [Deltaproteobacteria bacterium]
RDASSMTLGVKRERLPQLRAKIREFRQEILKLVANDTEPEEVALLNIQLYPVTKVPDAKEGRPSV